MTERKFTDEEVIKALECCKKLDYNFEECKQCPYGGKCYDGDVNFLQDIIDLINRQRAEIERLHSEVKEKTETIVFLKDQATGWSIDFCNLKAKLNTAKAEAIKEFAMRLKNAYTNKRYDKPNAHTLILYLFDKIDNLVKEMTEVKEQ